MINTNLEHSDYIVYVDESGDHSLQSINPRFPLFVLSFCVFQKAYYSRVVTPAVRMLKFATFGHDMVILHEHEIRKRIGQFQMMSRESREFFLEELSHLIASTDFNLIPIVIDKYKMKESLTASTHIYHLAMQLGLERLYQSLQSVGQENRLTYVVFEARGRVEDAALELEFRRVCDRNNILQAILPFDIVIADKKTNSEGLQFADMVSRPVGLSVLRPVQLNRAVKILEKKFYRTKEGKQTEHGPFIFPLKSERPQGSP